MKTKMEQPLILIEDIRKFARPCECENDIAVRCIVEAQQLDIAPAIGHDLYTELIEQSKPEANVIADNVLFVGGTYTGKDGKERTFYGVRTALAYYAYARIVRAGSGRQTRFGYVQKTDDYSQNAELKQRTSAYNEAFETADSYMVGVLEYVHYGLGNTDKLTMKNNRLKITRIGI